MQSITVQSVIGKRQAEAVYTIGEGEQVQVMPVFISGNTCIHLYYLKWFSLTDLHQ